MGLFCSGNKTKRRSLKKSVGELWGSPWIECRSVTFKWFRKMAGRHGKQGQLVTIVDCRGVGTHTLTQNLPKIFHESPLKYERA
jgi:hypothetical protein